MTALPLLFVLGALPGLVAVGAAIMAVMAIRRLAATAERQRTDAAVQRMLALFGPAAQAVHADPRQLLTWYPLARSSRAIFPEAFAVLDKAAGRAYPFTGDQVQAAHASWTAQWLGWERAHDAECSLKVAQVEEDIARGGGHASHLQRTRLAAIEQEKLERYQQRYEEYVKTAKALAALVE